MATQCKVGTSLNEARQRKLAEIVSEEPLACPSSVLAVSVDVMHRAWLASGRDLKRALSAIGVNFTPVPESAIRRPRKCA